MSQTLILIIIITIIVDEHQMTAGEVVNEQSGLGETSLRETFQVLSPLDTAFPVIKTRW